MGCVHDSDRYRPLTSQWRAIVVAWCSSSIYGILNILIIIIWLLLLLGHDTFATEIFADLTNTATQLDMLEIRNEIMPKKHARTSNELMQYSWCALCLRALRMPSHLRIFLSYCRCAHFAYRLIRHCKPYMYDRRCFFISTITIES